MYILRKGVNMTSRFLLSICCIIIVNFIVTFAGTITSAPSGGNWRDKTSWVNGEVPTEDDDVIVTSTIYCPGQSYSSVNLFAKSIIIESDGKLIKEENTQGLTTLTVTGDFINRGEVIDNSDYFDFTLGGQLDNEGILKPRTIVMNGSNTTLSTKKAIECKNFYVNTETELEALSDIRFINTRVTSSSNPRQVLNLKNYSLILTGTDLSFDGYYYKFNTNSYFSVELKTGNSVFSINNAILTGKTVGNVEVISTTHAIIADFEIEGDFKIQENTSVLARNHLSHIITRGDFYNYGSLGRDTITLDNIEILPLKYKISVFGNTHNINHSGLAEFYIYAENQKRTIEGYFGSNVNIYNEDTSTPGGMIELSRDTYVDDRLMLYSNLTIPKGTSLHLNKKYTASLYLASNNPELTVNGNLYRYHFVNDSWNYNTFDDPIISDLYLQLRDWDGEYLGNYVETHTTAYEGVKGCINKWWRLEPEGDINSYQYVARFYYDDEDLAGLNENDLNVFQSTDKGESWRLISFGEYVTHNKEENYFEIGVWHKEESHLTTMGDFIIGSVDGGVPLESPVCLDFTGRSSVRVGAPNRYSITMYNSTNKETSPFVLCFANTDRIKFTGVDFPGNTSSEYIPIDSIGDPEDALVFIVPYLGAHETYSFDVIAEGLPEGGIITDGKLAGGQSLSLGGFGKFLFDDQSDEVLADALKGAVELDSKEQREYALGMNLTVNQLRIKKQKDGIGVSTAKNAIKYTVENISKSNPITNVIYKIGSTVEFVHKISDSYRRRMWYWLYKETGLYGVEKSEPFGAKSKDANLVTSWDPNEISGPVGFGEFNFVQNLEIANYQILFENKAEAQASAYKIEILDTLDENVYDISTVKFGRTSQDGKEANWQMERKGNVLRWYIEGIELPPNKVPPQGEGWVNFSVKLKKSVTTGTEIKNKASIIFDLNDPIVTNTWINIIDDAAPSSQLGPISYNDTDNKLQLLATGSDNKSGSGIGKYLVFASINNAPYKLLGESYKDEISYDILNTTDTLFKFYTVAYDNVENMQQGISNIEEININNTSVYELDDLNILITASPIPVIDNLNITLENGLGRSGSLRISDILGNVVFERSIILSNNQDIFDIPFDYLSHGAYILDIIIEGRSKSIKIVK